MGVLHMTGEHRYLGR